jgi:hypothetical protein
MVTGGLETVLVGNPVDGQDDAIGIGERVRSFGDGADILGFRSNLFLAAALGNFGSVGALVTVEIRSNSSSTFFLNVVCVWGK